MPESGPAASYPGVHESLGYAEDNSICLLVL